MKIITFYGDQGNYHRMVKGPACMKQSYSGVSCKETSKGDYPSGVNPSKKFKQE